MEIGIVRGVITVVLLVLFIGLCAFSFSRRRRAEYDAAAHLPLMDDERPPVRTGEESTQ